MVFPSLGCLTCKRRRVKCDTTRPTCGRCLKANRTCNWESNEETGLPFRSENAFAGGQPRRPRRHQANSSRQNSRTLTAPPSQAPISLSLPLALHAFQYWVANYTTWPSDLIDFGHEYCTEALRRWHQTRPASSLELAISAFSLAVFGRARQLNKALEQADQFYVRSIIETRKEINHLSSETTGQLIVVTMLMASYNNIMYRAERRLTQNLPSAADEVGSRFWKDVCHERGTAGLLQVQQKQGCSLNKPLHRAVRRLIVSQTSPLASHFLRFLGLTTSINQIRACILRGETVQEWLQDGALYGEHGPTLDLDSLMIRVAALRSKSLHLLRDSNSALPSRIENFKKVATEAQELDLAFAAWSQDVPEEWKFSIYRSLESSGPDLLYNRSLHKYMTHGHAIIWIHYRAIRLIVNSIRMRLLSTLAQCTSQQPPTNDRLKGCQEAISLLATEFCLDIPFFFNLPSTMQDDPRSASTGTCENVTQPECEIVPKMATIIAWPLTVAVCIDAVPTTQKQWLQRRLKMVASVTGASALDSVLESGGFRF